MGRKSEFVLSVLDKGATRDTTLLAGRRWAARESGWIFRELLAGGISASAAGPGGHLITLLTLSSGSGTGIASS